MTVRTRWWVFALLAAMVAPARARSQTVGAEFQPVSYDLRFDLDFDRARMVAQARIVLRNASASPSRVVHLDLYHLLTATRVTIDDGEPAFTQQVRALEAVPGLRVNRVTIELPVPVPPGSTHNVVVDYEGALRGYAEVAGYLQDRIDAAFTLLRTDAWVYPIVPGGWPEFTHALAVNVPDSLVVAHGGVEIERRPEGQGRTTWRYHSRGPSWRIDIAVGPLGVIEAGPIRIFHLPGDAAGARDLMQAARQCLALYQRWWGPLIGTRSLTVIEVPPGWGSQADGMTILQEANAFRDHTRRHELYHELAHLWHVTPTDVPSPRWNEGLASMVAQLAVARLDGPDSALRDHWDDMAARVRRRLGTDSALAAVPLRDYGSAGVTDHAYTVGMLAMAVLYETVGEAAFHRGIGEFYRRHHATGGSTDEFIAIMSDGVAGRLDRLFDEWFETTQWTTLVTDGLDPRQIATRYR